MSCPFHLAFPVRDLQVAREFYTECVSLQASLAVVLRPPATALTRCTPPSAVALRCRVLGCTEGRSAATWVDFSLAGHQIVAHHVAGYVAARSANAVDGDPVPVPHFGLALSLSEFHALAERLRSKGVQFAIEPHLRFKGELLVAGAVLSGCPPHAASLRTCLLRLQASPASSTPCSSTTPRETRWSLRR